MFYIILVSVLVAFLGVYCILKWTAFKDNEKFSTVMSKILKIGVVVYCAIVFVSIFLPDNFTRSWSEQVAGQVDKGYAIVRWFTQINFVVLPLAVFYKNRTIKNIAIYFGVAISIASIFYYPELLADFTSTSGKGLNSIPNLPESFKNFLINGTFRSIFFGMTLTLQLLIPTILAIEEKHYFNFKDKKEYLYFFVCLPLILLSVIPIYLPQHLFGYSNVIFSAYSLPHILWLVAVVVEIVALYFIFRKKDRETKMILLFVLALSLILQYNQMFGAISFNMKRLPLQLCNLGSYFVLLSLITKSKKLFNFTVIINVVGVIFALAMPDLDNKGFFYLYNMHFILEHTNVMVVPILALMFGIFPRLDKYALRDCLVGFLIYFVSVFAIGTALNAVAKATGDTFYEVNFLFMLLPKDTIDVVEFSKVLFDVNFQIGYGTFYPVVQLIVLCAFLVICTLLYFAIRLLYKFNDVIKKKLDKNELNDENFERIITILKEN